LIGILHPLANPATLKNLSMCNFGKPAYGNGRVLVWKNKNHTNPWTPGRPRPGVFEYALGVCYQTIFEKKGVFP